jgi:putative transposase
MSEPKPKRVMKPKIPSQTLTARANIGAVDDGTALLLGLLGFAATKLWNTALWYCKELWDTTGIIPNYHAVNKHLKESENRWYRSVHAQSAQGVLEELWGSYKSWFALRKKGDSKARPPSFRRKTSLSTVTFKKDSISYDPETKTLRLGIPGAVFEKKELVFRLSLQPDLLITAKNIQMVRLSEDKGVWTAHLVYRIPKVTVKTGGHTLSIDLGQKHLITSACTDGSTNLYPGGELLALDRYFEKEKSKCTNVFSNKRIRLEILGSRQRNHFIHCLTRTVINDALARDVSTIVVGDIKDIRIGKDGESKNWGDSGNQQLHRWSFEQILYQLRYKAAMVGITVVTISEAYTSQDCCICTRRRKANRQHRGLYVCDECGMAIHADVNGAINILQRYLPGHRFLGVVGVLAHPAVNLFAWRNTRPFVREQGTWTRSKEPPTSVNHPLAA